MLHLANDTYTRRDAPSILRRARALVAPDMTVRDVRVASSHIEMDVTIPDNTLEPLTSYLSTIGIMRDARRVTEEYVPKNEAITQGISYFNDERYWECHESFEGVWKECHEGEKDLLQGIILAAAGLVHYQKDQDTICLSIFGRALQKLSRCTGTYHTINVESLRNKLSNMRSTGTITTFELA